MTNEADPRRLLGAFIRTHRERLTPPAQGTGRRRRTPGWRREELADACGLGVTWITWLEQGRPITASAPALARLAQALELTPAERTSLFDLAGRRDPDAPDAAPYTLAPELLALPGRFNGPAYLLDRTWNAVAWNPQAERLFTGWLDAGAADRNLLRFVFLAPAAQRLITGWPERAQRLAAEFRADYNRRPRDAALQSLAGGLENASPAFRAHWRAQTVLTREGGERGFHHPRRGALRYQQTTLLVAAQQDVKLVCLVPIQT